MGIFISFPLWTQDRLFPLLPVFNFLNFPSFIGNYLIYVLLGVLISILFFPKKITISLALLLLLLLGLEDQMRWQPWVYIYLLFFLGFIFRIPASNRLFYFRLLLISIYFWSGIHKINPNFVDHIFIPMARDVFMLHIPKYRIIGYGVSLLEIGIGIGLAFKLTQRYAFYALFGLHVIILLWVSPWGKNTNQVIIPWNLVMIGLSYVCFYSKAGFSFSEQLLNLSFRKAHKALLLVFFLLPLLSYIEMWPYYFSYHLYSGKGQILSLAYKEVPSNISKEYYFQLPQDSNLKNYNGVNLNKWSYLELGVPIPSNLYVFKQLAAHFCSLSKESEPKFLLFKTANYYGVYKIYSCSTLDL